MECNTHRIECPVHGVLVADVPWAYPNSGFTKDFDLTASWLAAYLPRSTVSEYMRIDWETVGRCVHRTLGDIEPERSRRLDNLVNMGIDETSYKKGHKYITVIVNHDTNTVVWAAQGHGKGVLTQFYKQLTPEQLSSIRVVTGDGAKWITECVNEFTLTSSRKLNLNVFPPHFAANFSSYYLIYHYIFAALKNFRAKIEPVAKYHFSAYSPLLHGAITMYI